MKRYLFIMRRLPYSGGHLQETLDAILTVAAFDQHVALLFVDDAVWQLKNQQQPGGLDLKDTSAIFQALQIYDVNDLYVEEESLQLAGLTSTDLILPVVSLPRVEVSRLMHRYDLIISD
ncbi:sulfurtransferase complex subunit TusC [Methylomonas fluvii]|uniref:Sulfurtransferase complex subunit TusC n=1 Tax=Methylomonas fluvii TaxID=1854564 RepID=A0ABR9DJC0_9GAMM|nr:sulfurtransferase complex subunit TusC [Methylomonas fluvii]MBD9363194.1 sulfurtransferase complex subunit TusC [Methylomonas fluvii]